MKTIKTIDIIRYNGGRGKLYKLLGFNKANQVMGIFNNDNSNFGRSISNRVRIITYNYISDRYLNRDSYENY